MSYDVPHPRDLLPNHLAFNSELERMRELVRDLKTDVEDLSQILVFLLEGKGKQGMKKAEGLLAVAQEFEDELDNLRIYRVWG